MWKFWLKDAFASVASVWIRTLWERFANLKIENFSGDYVHMPRFWNNTFMYLAL
jgi:hypothetical protein